MSGDIKINRIKQQNKRLFTVLDEALNSGEMEARSPDMRDKLAAVKERQEYLTTVEQLTKFTRGTNFSPDRKFQLVANQVDPAVWRVITDMFARIDPETKAYMDDGLLYVTDDRGNIVLNKPFFYALLSGPLRKWDSRGRIVV